MSLTKEKIQENYEKHLKIVKNYIGDRQDKVLSMIDAWQEEYAIAPASSKTWYHSAFPGGYVDHVNRVVEYAVKQMRLYKEMGGEIDFTEEELIFSCLHHDLGKLGIKGELHYLPNQEEWSQKKYGTLFVRNENIPYMTLTDRTFFTLNHYGIQYNEKEYFAIKLTDGMYDEDNQKYLAGHDLKKQLVYKLQFIMHWADHMSTIIERQDNVI